MISIISKKSTPGFTLVEILVVIFIFAFVGILSTQALILSLKGSKKSDSTIKVKENAEYSLSFMERALRNAQSLQNCSASAKNRLDFTDQDGNPKYFECDSVGKSISTNYPDDRINRLTSPDVYITNCPQVFTCDASRKPHVVDIELSVQDAKASAEEGSQITTSTRVLLRNY